VFPPKYLSYKFKWFLYWATFRRRASFTEKRGTLSIRRKRWVLWLTMDTARDNLTKVSKSRDCSYGLYWNNEHYSVWNIKTGFHFMFSLPSFSWPTFHKRHVSCYIAWWWKSKEGDNKSKRSMCWTETVYENSLANIMYVWRGMPTASVCVDGTIRNHIRNNPIALC